MDKKKIAEIMNQEYNPRKVAENKYEAYKKYILEIIEDVKECVEDLDLELLEKISFDSYAGDGYGDNNSCINFAYEENDKKDLHEALEYLIWLRKYADGLIPIDCEFPYEKTF